MGVVVHRPRRLTDYQNHLSSSWTKFGLKAYAYLERFIRCHRLANEAQPCEEKMKDVPSLHKIRTQLMMRLKEVLSVEQLPLRESKIWEDFPNFVRPVLIAAGLAAFEADHWRGEAQAKKALCEGAVRTLERATHQFQARGAVTPTGDMNTAEFALVPFTFALISLKPHISDAKHRRLRQCATVCAHAGIDRQPDPQQCRNGPFESRLDKTF